MQQPHLTPSDKDKQKLRSFNRLQLLIWLENYSDFFGKQSKGMTDFQEMGKPQPSAPLRAAQYRYLDNEDAYQSHRKLLAAVAKLKRDRWHLWMLLHRLYLDENAEPGLVEHWKQDLKESDGEGSSKVKLKLREAAVGFILDEVEGHRLVVPHAPLGGRGPKDHSKKVQRHEALRAYFRRLELGAKKTAAAKEVAAEFSVALSTVYTWLTWMSEDKFDSE